MNIISRQEAKAAGLPRYFNGKPCPHGHLSERRTRNCECVECMATYARSEKYKEHRKALVVTPEQRDKDNAYSAKYHAENRARILEEMRARNKVYYAKNKKKILANVKTYVAENKEWRRGYATSWNKQKRETDPVFAMQCVMRKFVARVLDRIKQNRTERERERTKDILGYTAQEFMAHIEPMFKTGMTWSNHGEWHVDHIRPLASFDLFDQEQRMMANSLHNLQPLWAAKNLKKSDAWDGQASLI